MTVYHPGVDHGHLPSGRWAEVQANPNSSTVCNAVCAICSPYSVVVLAMIKEFGDKPIALAHLNYYLAGSGADFNEDTNIERMLRRDRGVQALIGRSVPAKVRSGVHSGHVKIEQSDYADQDLRFAFGAVDRLDFEVNFTAGTLKAWFQDRYEWHPYYPGLYSAYSDDGPRETNCVHAALVELKSEGAADFWMKGEATVPLSLFPALAPVGKSGKPY